MIDLEPYVGELVLVLLARPVPYVGRGRAAFEPIMIPDPNQPPPNPALPASAPENQQRGVPAITDNIQGLVQKRGTNYTLTYTNPLNNKTRISVVLEPALIHAVYSLNEIALVSPAEMPPLPTAQ